MAPVCSLSRSQCSSAFGEPRSSYGAHDSLPACAIEKVSDAEAASLMDDLLVASDATVGQIPAEARQTMGQKHTSSQGCHENVLRERAQAFARQQFGTCHTKRGPAPAIEERYPMFNGVDWVGLDLPQPGTEFFGWIDHEARATNVAPRCCCCRSMLEDCRCVNAEHCWRSNANMDWCMMDCVEHKTYDAVRNWLLENSRMV